MEDYRVSFTVPADALPDVTAALSLVMERVSHFSVHEATEAPRPKNGERPQTPVAERRTPKFVLAIIRGSSLATLKTDAIGEFLKEKGLSPNSASPALSMLRAAGLVERVADNTFRLTEAGRQAGS